MPVEILEPAFFAGSADGILFDQAPLALWAEDFSALKAIFERLRAQGVSDLAAHLAAHPALVQSCAESLRVLQVNRRGLDMLEAVDFDDLSRNLHIVFSGDVLPAYTNELLQLWAGQTAFASTSVNYTLGGKRLDIRLNGVILPGFEADWSRVLVAIEDVTATETARRQLQVSEAYARSLFNDSPASLWVEDFSTIKRLLDGLRARGITDFVTFTDVHPDFVDRCMDEIRVVDVNRQTLALFGAPDKATLLSRLGDIFRDEMRVHFNGQLIELWHGRLRHEREVVNYNLAGETLNLVLQFSVMPGHEQDWGQVLIALTDITARKKAEAYLEYLGMHDVLTGLYNRAFYADEINRLDRKGPFPVGVIIIDLNGMKSVNDDSGHAAGDALLRRAGEILAQVVEKPGCAARIGGDEFVMLLPAASTAQMQTMLDALERITEMNNQYHAASAPVSFSIGCASCAAGERLESAIQRADALMYEHKRQFYTKQPGMDRRAKRVAMRK